MIFRAARVEDISNIFKVRLAVAENKLNDPNSINAKDCELYLTQRGKGWLCEINQTVVGFSIIDLKENKVWALFLLPEFEGKGIGRKLHELMLHWYFEQGKEELWLSTSPNTRAEGFYRKLGWTENGKHKGDEIRFTMNREQWLQSNNAEAS